ncbi:unnamed protein product, partial [marine sediment metagenome]
VCPEEIKGQHISNDVPKATMDKHAGHYGPWPKQETCWL